MLFNIVISFFLNFKIMRSLFLIILAQLTFLFSSSMGSITGSVIDANTHQPLPGANVILIDTDLGIASDIEGKFKLGNIPVGSYSISVSMIGYESQSRANINIYSDRKTPLNFYLDNVILEADAIKVTAGFFEKAKDGIVSTQTIGIQEIRSDPIGSYDIQMMVHSLPSVVTATDQNNEIIVRGGGPGENLFIMDNLEIPNPNHFGEVGSGGGPINILNTEFVERIDFFAGGFPARYGDKQSSVMDITLREGSYDQFNLDMELSAGGFGLLAEGPFAKKKGSYIASFRQAFLKYIIKSAGLSAIPEYKNYQFKSVYNLDPRQKIIINIVGGSDYIKIEDEDRPDLKGAENVEHWGSQYTAGLTYKTLIFQNGYSLLSFGQTSSKWITDVYSMKMSQKDTYFSRDNIETDNFIKWDIVYKLSSSLELSFGINSKYGQFNLKEDLDPDTLYFYNYPELDSDSNLEDYYSLIANNTNYDNYFIIPDPISGDTTFNQGFISSSDGGIWKYAAYNQFKLSLKKLIVTAGVRYDQMSENNTSVIAPRLGLSYAITPVSKINLAIGKFYQTPSYWMLLNPLNENSLRHSYTNQNIIGLEHLFADDFKGTLEFYSKYYYNKAIQLSTITLDSLDNRLGFIDTGKGRASGVELFLQKKFSRKWYGTLSYSKSKAEGFDSRQGKNKYYPWDFDFENTLTIVGGYKIKFIDQKWYKNFRESDLFPYLAWIPIMVSDQLELSFRYSFSGGRPYTPKNYDFRHRVWYDDSYSELNTERYNNYSRLDIMILRRFNFKNINLTTYLDIQNIFNRSNEWERVYMEDGSFEMSYQYKQFPVGGVIIEF